MTPLFKSRCLQLIEIVCWESKWALCKKPSALPFFVVVNFFFSFLIMRSFPNRSASCINDSIE